MPGPVSRSAAAGSVYADELELGGGVSSFGARPAEAISYDATPGASWAHPEPQTFVQGPEEGGGAHRPGASPWT